MNVEYVQQPSSSYTGRDKWNIGPNMRISVSVRYWLMLYRAMILASYHTFIYISVSVVYIYWLLWQIYSEVMTVRNHGHGQWNLFFKRALVLFCARRSTKADISACSCRCKEVCSGNQHCSNIADDQWSQVNPSVTGWDRDFRKAVTIKQFLRTDMWGEIVRKDS